MLAGLAASCELLHCAGLVGTDVEILRAGMSAGHIGVLRMLLLRVLRDQPQACTMTAMKLSRDPLIHPTAGVIRPRFPTEIGARPEALAWRDPNPARLHAALVDTR